MRVHLGMYACTLTTYVYMHHSFICVYTYNISMRVHLQHIYACTLTTYLCLYTYNISMRVHLQLIYACTLTTYLYMHRFLPSQIECAKTPRCRLKSVCCSVFHYVAVCCSVLQCVAVCCSVLQCARTPRRHLNSYMYVHVYVYVNAYATAGQSKLSFLKNKIDKLCKDAKVPSELELSVYLTQDPEREQLSPEVHTYMYSHV